MASFDLRSESWLPCLTDEGPSERSLLEVLTRSHNIRELVGDSPPITIALHRLLIAILHRILRGPKNTDEWNELYARGSFDAEQIKEYFDRFADRFDLFHEKYPFYQAASAREHLQDGAAIQLYFQGKNNATLFEHTSTTAPKSISPAEAARLIVAFQGFDFGGIKADGSAQTAPLLQSAVALVRGKNLFETLMLNLHRYDGENASPFVFDEGEDLPAWEREEETHSAVRWPAGPVDLLTWQPRRLAIEASEDKDGSPVIRNAVVMLGYSFPKDVALHAKETMMAFRKNKDGQMFSIGFSENRALWRNSESLIKATTADHARPRSLDWVNELRLDGYIGKQKLPIDVYGLAADKAKLLFWNHERFDLPLAFLSDVDLTANLGRCLAFAEEVGSAVRASMKALADELETERETFFAEGNFWSQLESRFHALLDRLPSDREAEMRAWFADTLRTASGAFRETVNSLSGTAAEVEAAVKAENMLWGVISKAIKANATSWAVYLPEKFAAKGGQK
ncbi:MAG: type I-E CRISPR-associated protein Cse1/CasA [Pyrinomonadaceae bacterium]